MGYNSRPQTWFLGGYFLVDPVPPDRDPLTAAASADLISVSDCVHTVYPGLAGLSWTSVDDEERDAWNRHLGVGPNEAAALRGLCDQLFEEGGLGWWSVFRDLEALAQFRAAVNPELSSRWRALGIATTRDYREEYLARLGGASDGEEDGVSLMLREAVVCQDLESALCGFEVLGAKGGAFHSFHCNQLEKTYSDMGIALNRAGLIDDFASAETAAAFTNSRDALAEAVLWQPWAVFVVA